MKKPPTTHTHTHTPVHIAQQVETTKEAFEGEREVMGGMEVWEGWEVQVEQEAWEAWEEQEAWEAWEAWEEISVVGQKRHGHAGGFPQKTALHSDQDHYATPENCQHCYLVQQRNWQHPWRWWWLWWWWW